MKKIIAAASSLGMALSLSLAVPMPAQAASKAAVAEFCKGLSEAFPIITVGQCVGYVNGNSDAAKVCALFKDLGVLEYFEANMGNCVSTIRHL